MDLKIAILKFFFILAMTRTANLPMEGLVICAKNIHFIKRQKSFIGLWTLVGTSATFYPWIEESIAGPCMDFHRNQWISTWISIKAWIIED